MSRMDRVALFRIGVVGIPILVILAIYFTPVFAGGVYLFLKALAPLWLPPLLALMLWPLWITFIRSQYTSTIHYRTLELKPGDNTPKTAKPMELVFYSLYYRTDITLWNSLLKGVVRVPWGFEVVAKGGIVRFFVHVPAHHLAAVEGRLRAEYRDVDIDEVRDYSREEHFNPFDQKVLMREYSLTKNDAYPIRTYETDEHAKIRQDTFSDMLEELTSVGDGEEIWGSLMIRPHQRDWGTSWYEYLNPPADTLHLDAHREIQRIVGASGDVRNLPESKQEMVAAIEKALQKPSFDCGLRVVYRAHRSKWNEERAMSIDRLFNRFGDDTLNSFESYDPRASVGWPLSDIFVALPAFDMEYFLKLYRRRAFFTPPYYGRSFILNTEELATLWHLPKVGRASALSRMRGKRLEPPENLPI